MRMKPPSGPKKTNPNKPNFHQEMPKMLYLPACLKRHYAGGCFTLIVFAVWIIVLAVLLPD